MKARYMQSSVKIFTGNATRELAGSIADSYGQDLGKLEMGRFSDGEISTFYDESIRGNDIFLIQSTFPPADNLMELLLMIDAARRASAGYVTVAIPYFGYARQDRKDKPRVAIAAKMVANLLSAAGADRVMTCDLHADQIQGFFDVPVDHLNASTIFIPYLKGLGLEKPIIASPDVGGIKRARHYAKKMGCEFVICDKHREKANEVASMQLIGDVTGADVILIDDLMDTGNTMCKAADMLMTKGANSVRAVCTHPVLSGKAYENINNSSLVELVVTDTIPLKEESDKIKVLSVADLFATAIRRIHDRESISSLFT